MDNASKKSTFVVQSKTRQLVQLSLIKARWILRKVKHRWFDEKDKEIGMIASLDDLPKSTARLLEDELNRRYFAPVIEKVLSVKEEFGYTYSIYYLRNTSQEIIITNP